MMMIDIINVPLVNMYSHENLCLLEFTPYYQHMFEFSPKACVFYSYMQLTI